MPKYSVGLAWTDDERSELVEDTDERAKFMAYGPGTDVPDKDAAKVNKKIKPVGGDKQRAVPENKDATPKPGLHTGGANSVKGA
jgi:hypothetical protein